MKKYFFVFALLVLFSTAVFAEITCDIKLDCVGDEVALFYLTDTVNAHVSPEPKDNYNYKACCKNTDPEVGPLKYGCIGFYAQIFTTPEGGGNLASKNPLNEHYTKYACFNLGETMTCNIRDLSTLPGHNCPAGTSCIIKTSGTTNAHAYDCSSDYATTGAKFGICCKKSERDVWSVDSQKILNSADEETNVFHADEDTGFSNELKVLVTVTSKSSEDYSGLLTVKVATLEEVLYTLQRFVRPGPYGTTDAEFDFSGDDLSPGSYEILTSMKLFVDPDLGEEYRMNNYLNDSIVVTSGFKTAGIPGMNLFLIPLIGLSVLGIIFFRN